jgi:hypothetical protein
MCFALFYLGGRFLPIIARSLVALAHVTDILHDLYFPLPRNGLRAENGSVVIVLTDQDLILDDQRVSEFRLTVRHVIRTEMAGVPEKNPELIQFDEFRYKPNDKVLSIKTAHPVRFIFQLESLHIELEQVA